MNTRAEWAMSHGRLMIGPFIIAAGAGCGVFLTVGLPAAVVGAAIVLIDGLLRWHHRFTGLMALATACLVPVLWFVGSGLPLWPPPPRIQENWVVHEAAGLTLWLLFLSVMTEWYAKQGRRDDFGSE